MARDFAFLHAADIHIDSPLSGLSAKNETFSRLVKGATRRAFSNLVDLAIQERVDFVVIAGDLYDGTWKDQGTGQFATAQLGRLSRAGVRVFVIFGNHDAESRVTRHLSPPPGVHLLSNRRCETVVLEELGVAVHGRSYKEAATTENLAATYCPPSAGLFNLAILHTALEGHASHERYAPCTIDELRSTGHNYWALGHVHEASIRSDEPFVVFPGNLQGRHVRETGPKGAMLVRVVDGAVSELEFKPCDEVRWAQTAVDAADARDSPELLASVDAALRTALHDLGPRPAATRITVQARGPLRRRLLADPEWFKAEVQARASLITDELWIESVRLMTADEPAFLAAELADLLASADEDAECARALQSAVRPLLDKLPPDVGEPGSLLAAARTGDMAALLAAAKRSLEARLAEAD